MKQESSGCLELNSLFGCSINTKVFLGIIIKEKKYENILNISFIEGIKTTGNRKKTSLLPMKEKQLQH